MTQRTLSVLVTSALSLVGCGDPPNCQPGYDGGERFRITVLGDREPGSNCDSSPLHPGDSFELTALDVLTPLAEGDGCHVRAAVGTIPAFFGPTITECIPGQSQLALDCKGLGPDGCTVLVRLGIGPYIASGMSSIEDGLLNLSWGGCQVPMACGGNEQYRVRIERLAPATD
ncbi:MAG: hypothetical protein QM784_25685 [Polyangiaceae bacterium]